MRQTLIILIAMIVLACQKEIVLEQPYYEKQVVVDGYIESGHYAYIFLTASSPFLTEYDSVSITETFINNATITLTSSLGETEVLTLFRQNTFFPPFVYRSVSIKGKVGATYQLDVKVGGRLITATTTIPVPPVVDSIYMEPSTDSTGILKASLHFNTGKNGYVLMQVKSTLSEENLHACYNPVLSIDADNTQAIANILRSRETSMYYVHPQEEYYSGYPKFQYSLNDSILVKIGSLDQEGFQVMKSVFLDQASNENPFIFHNDLVTNINGGIGRWTGIGVAPVLIYKPKKTI